MNHWNAWRSSLGLASLGFALIGCGGGDVPDPDSDPTASVEAPAAPAPPTESASAPAAAPGDPAAPAAPAEPAAPGMPTEAPAAVAAAPAPASAEAPADTTTEATAEPAKLKTSATTAEMLALGNKPLPEVSPAPAATPANPNDPAAAMAMAPGMPGAAPGAPGADAEMAQARALAAGPGAPGAPGIPGEGAAPGAEMPGYPGAGDGAGGEHGPANFHSPHGAVRAFLGALKAKNAEQLAEATARRAPTEATGPKNQKLFQSILDFSLTEDDMSELANKLEGFQIVGNNVPKSTGRYALILGKPGKNGEYYRRTITTRHEKDGWKVSDISGLGTIEKPIMIRGGMRRTR